jgi:hypothetical protein
MSKEDSGEWPSLNAANEARRDCFRSPQVSPDKLRAPPAFESATASLLSLIPVMPPSTIG